MTTSTKILVLGASGYVGARLIPSLLEKGFSVRAAGRSLKTLQGRPWADDPRLELFPVDVLGQESLTKACAGCVSAYYLIHSMNTGYRDFADADRKAARNMADAAYANGIKRIIYLGGLGDTQTTLSLHLRSRMEVSQILHSGRVPATTLRAAMIIGTGGAAYEILSYMVRRLPVMITPVWVSTESQPISIRNVLGYLVGCLEHDQTANQVYDIGGVDILSYRRLMDIYAEEARLAKRWIIPLPILTPRLNAYWAGLVTPVPVSIIRPLAEGLRNRLVCRDNRIRSIISQELLDCRQAIRLTLKPHAAACEESSGVKTYAPPECQYPGDPPWVGGYRR